MKPSLKRNQLKKKRQARIRGKLFGTAQRPRLTVYRSNHFTYVQVINDELGQTLASANDLMLRKAAGKAVPGTKVERAEKIAKELEKQLKKLNITKLCFDRGSYRYHGRLAVIADTLRAAGVEV